MKNGDINCYLQNYIMYFCLDWEMYVPIKFQIADCGHQLAGPISAIILVLSTYFIQTLSSLPSPTEFNMIQLHLSLNIITVHQWNANCFLLYFFYSAALIILGSKLWIETNHFLFHFHHVKDTTVFCYALSGFFGSLLRSNGIFHDFWLPYFSHNLISKEWWTDILFPPCPLF